MAEERNERLSGRRGLPESDPEAVTIADCEFAHTIKGVVEVFDDFGFTIEAGSQRIYVVNMGVEIAFTSGSGTQRR